MGGNNLPSLLDLIRDVPLGVWVLIKSAIFGILLLGGMALVFCCAACVGYGVWSLGWWLVPRMVELPGKCREEYRSWQARRVSRMVDREVAREREEELEMLGKREGEGEGRMSGETLHGGEEKGEGK